MLTAGTVKPLTSPRPRAMYSSWMLADGDAELLRRFPDQPARDVDDVLVLLAEGGRPDADVDASLAERRFVVDHQPATIDVGDAGQRVEHLADRGCGHGVGHRLRLL